MTGEGTTLRYDEDGELDEVVGVGRFHLERMADDEWSLIVNGTTLAILAWREAGRMLVTATVVEAGGAEERSERPD